MKIQVKQLSKDGQVPVKAHKTDAGFDLFAAEDILILPGERFTLKTGIAIDVPNGWEAEIRGRSGLNGKTGLHIANGTVDAGYRGEILVIVKNTNPTFNNTVVDISSKKELNENARNYQAAYTIKKGSRIAQVLFHVVPDIELVEVEDFSDTTERGTNGFGSSGI